jgi:hypothetical protein
MEIKGLKREVWGRIFDFLEIVKEVYEASQAVIPLKLIVLDRNQSPEPKACIHWNSEFSFEQKSNTQKALLDSFLYYLTDPASDPILKVPVKHTVVCDSHNAIRTDFVSLDDELVKISFSLKNTETLTSVQIKTKFSK